MPRTRNPVFVAAEEYLTNNPGKTLADFYKHADYDGPKLKTRHRKGAPISVTYKGASSAAETKRSKLDTQSTDRARADNKIQNRDFRRMQDEASMFALTDPEFQSQIEHDLKAAHYHDHAGTTGLTAGDPSNKFFQQLQIGKDKSVKEEFLRNKGLDDDWIIQTDEQTGGTRLIDAKKYNPFGFISEQGTPVKSIKDIAKHVGLKINDNGIKNGLSAVIPDAIEFIPTIDEMIGSPLDRAIGNGVNSVKTALGYKANPVPNGEVNPTVQRGLEILAKFYQNGSKAVDTNGISSL
jgi:hypothetical protein